MKSTVKIIFTILIVSSGIFLSSYINQPGVRTISFPYKQAGLTEKQAAAHLLSRFTYGATSRQVDEVVSIGLEKWLQQQLSGKLNDDALNQRLINYDAIHLSNTEVSNTYPKGGQLIKMAIKEGIINKDSIAVAGKKEYKDQIAAYMRKNGYKPQQELFRQFINQKILRASYTNNQTQEILTDFWFNHFNVSITKNQCAEFIPAYERDVIRPNVFGKFSDLLIATAKSPAMLYYLDNFSSSGTNTNLENNNKKRNSQLDGRMQAAMKDSTSQKAQFIKKLQQAKKTQGLNENYAREVMELHTLGVDGGYTQEDVTEAAKVLTGWTVYPMGDNGSTLQNIIEKAGEGTLEKRGFVHDGDFLFVPSRHNNQEKIVLGKKFPANGGYQEGVDLLNMLAHHASTAKFICTKLAIRFVNDHPSQSLIDKMAKTFTDQDGDIKQVLLTMVNAPEFWSKESLREKTKSPFELAISTVRSLGADVKQPYQLYNWITKMGQKLYYYQAPTGFPDKGQYWINTGSLLNRMNFGLAITSQQISGIKVNLAAINNNHEPESAEAALITYSKLIMPERNIDETIKRLTPMLNDPELVRKVDAAAGKQSQTMDVTNNEDIMIADEMQDQKEKISKTALAKSVTDNNTMLARVVGVIIGSPEFQRK